jgi:hypothetical protein
VRPAGHVRLGMGTRHRLTPTRASRARRSGWCPTETSHVFNARFGRDRLHAFVEFFSYLSCGDPCHQGRVCAGEGRRS